MTVKLNHSWDTRYEFPNGPTILLESRKGNLVFDEALEMEDACIAAGVLFEKVANCISDTCACNSHPRYICDIDSVEVNITDRFLVIPFVSTRKFEKK